MSQKFIPKEKAGCQEQQMANTGEQAKSWANKLILGESRGPGDMENAMRRLEARYGIPRSVLFALRYRPTKDPKASIYLRLQNAWTHFKMQQLRALQHEIAIAASIAGPDHDSIRAVASVVFDSDEPPPGEMK